MSLVVAALTPGMMPHKVVPPMTTLTVLEQGLLNGPEQRQIFQAPGYVVITMAIGVVSGDYRIIPLDGRPALGPKIRQYTGESRGRWEGNTLVVETTNANDQQFGGATFPVRKVRTHLGSGATLRVTERYTRLDDGTLEYRSTIEDPEVYTRPWTAVYELARQPAPEMVPLPNGGCHEYNRGLAHILVGARDPEGQRLSLQAAEEFAQERALKLKQLKAEWAELNQSR